MLPEFTQERHSVLLTSHPQMLDHDMGPGHCERPDRLRVILDDLRRNPIENTGWRRSERAACNNVALIHKQSYLDRLNSLRGKSQIIDPDTTICPATIDAAMLAAGAAIQSVDAVMQDECSRAFALVRPPGHHATPDRAMGFCFLNNIAIGAAHAIATHGVERVLIFDWDVHHGNGTQHALYERNDAYFVSAHQWPLYPGTGAEYERGGSHGEGFTRNIPMHAGCGDELYLETVTTALIRIAAEYQPQLVMVSAGFDAHVRDPLGGLQLSTECFGELTALICELADTHADGRAVLVLEGGYELIALRESVRACIEQLAAPD